MDRISAPARLAERAPSARFLATGRLAGHEFRFHQAGTGPGKQMSVQPAPERTRYGVRFSISRVSTWHGLPGDYLQRIARNPAVDDPYGRGETLTC